MALVNSKSKTATEERLWKKAKRGDDKISELPDDILCHILSFLPSKEACATSLLSTRWRSLWTMVPVVHFKGFSTINIHEFMKHRRVTQATRVILEEPQKHCQEHMDKWVSSFVAGNVEHLQLSLGYAIQELLLPTNLFTCSTLVTLKLKGRFYMHVPLCVHLPSLRTLHLKLDEEQDNDSVSRLIYGCPVLEEFHMRFLDWECEELLFEISVPTLKKLKFVGECFVFERLEINAPCIESIQIQGCDIQDLVIGEFKNLVKVGYHISNLTEPVYSPWQLLPRLSNVQELSLGDYWDEMITLEDSSILGLPQFNHLIRLQLTLREGYLSLHLLQLLANCPKLQVLAIEKVFGYQPKPLYLADTVSLSPHLTVFEYRRYDEHDLPLVAYILRRAKALKMMKINAYNVAGSKKIRMHKQISKLLKSSPCVCRFN